MTQDVLFELLADRRELIATTWYYFLTVNLALFAVVYVAQRRTRAAERFFLLVGYAGFLAMNYLAHVENYADEARIIAEILALDGPDGIASRLVGPGAAGDAAWVKRWLPHLYGAAGLIGGGVIAFTNRSERRDR